MTLLVELKRRNVFRVAAAYVVLSWLILQMGDLLFDLMGLPDWANRIVLVILLLGFPVALLFSWVYEITPEGIKRESEIDRSHSITPETGKKLDYVTLAALVAVVLFVMVERNVRKAEPAPAVETPTIEQPTVLATADLSIAVLPFANMSADAENEYFADGLTEELLNLLAQIEQLKVAGRTSSFYFKGRNEPLQSIGRQLNVAHVLEGSVRRSGDKLRITAQLVKVDDGYHLWSQTYDRVMDDVFAIQEDIARSITESLKIKLELSTEILAGQTENTEAYSLYLQGRQKWNTRAIDELREAIQLFRRALELDPGFALAWSGLADAIDALAYRVVEARELVPEAMAAARRAIELDPQQPAGYASLGILQVEFENDFSSGAENLQRARDLNPNYVPALYWSIDMLRALRRLDEASAVCDRVLAIDPLAVIALSSCAAVLFAIGQEEEAIAMWKRSLEISPDVVNISFRLPLNAVAHGHMDVATAAPYLIHWATLRGVEVPERVELILEVIGNPSRRPEALDLVRELESVPDMDPMDIFYLYEFVGDRERALDRLETLSAEGHPQLFTMLSATRLNAELVADPRFKAVVRGIGLPEREPMRESAKAGDS